MADSNRTLDESDQSVGVLRLRQPHSLHRFRVATTQGNVLGMAVFWAAALLTALEPSWHVLLLLPTIAMSFLLALKWERVSRNLLACSLIVGVVTAFVGSILTVTPFAAGGLLIAGAAGIPTLRRSRLIVAVSLICFATGVSLFSAVFSPEQTPTYVTITVAFGILWVAVFSGAFWTMQVMNELDNAHRVQTELALYQEKFRFAADLHDIQGHTLHVVKMKTALAQKLLNDSPVVADRELEDVRGLLTETISQAKSLAYGQRRLTLYGELENAKNLLEATGASVSVYRSANDLPVEYEEAASLVLRETTTNILRHSDATQVKISVGSSGVSIINDGIPDDEARKLSGLYDLQQRISDSGGELIAQRDNNRFLTEVRFHTSQKGLLP